MITFINDKNKGSVALVSILVIMAVSLAIALSINLGSISELKMGFSESKSSESLFGADGCVSESLIRLAWDSSYTGGTLDFGGGSCIITISGSGSTRTIDVSSMVDDLTRKIQVGVTLSGSSVTIDSWREPTN